MKVRSQRLVFVLSLAVGFLFPSASSPNAVADRGRTGERVIERSRAGDLHTIAPTVRGTRESRSSSSPEIRLADLQSLRAPHGRPLESSGGSEKGETVYKRESGKRRPLIAIDPGHGGDDLGAVGVDGSLEKDVVLRVAFFLDELLRERLRAETLLTRRTDVAVPLAERTRRANESQADIFISIHANASEYRNVSGIETYYLDNTDDKSSLKLAERENRAGGGGGVPSDLSFIISDLIQNAKLEDSIVLAHLLQDSLVKTLSRYYRGVKNLGVKKAPFFVLVGAHMPCVLTEVAFIDHPVEGLRLVDERYQRLLAEAMYRGIVNYFERREQ